MLATLSSAAASATDVPPNFMTIDTRLKPRNDQKRPAASEHDRPLLEIANSLTRLQAHHELSRRSTPPEHIR
jgi:hypothetical protein